MKYKIFGIFLTARIRIQSFQWIIYVFWIVSEYTKFYKVKSRNITPERTSIVMELRVKDGGSLVQKISGIEGVAYVSIIDHDGEVTF